MCICVGNAITCFVWAGTTKKRSIAPGRAGTAKSLAEGPTEVTGKLLSLASKNIIIQKLTKTFL